MIGRLLSFSGGPFSALDQWFLKTRLFRWSTFWKLRGICVKDQIREVSSTGQFPRTSHGGWWWMGVFPGVDFSGDIIYPIQIYQL